MTSIKEALREASMRLTASTTTPELDASILLAKLLNKSKSYLYAYSECLLDKKVYSLFQALVSKRQHGVPVAYLTGEREFWSFSLEVNTDTLIPRPETELLVELALELLQKPTPTVLDLGTGSGAIALACALERPHWKITASDISDAALVVAKRNASKLGIDSVKFYQADCFTGLPATDKYDLILTNPPYIGTNEKKEVDIGLSYEPAHALYAGPDGLEIIQRIISESLARLKPDGLLLIEHGFKQKTLISRLLTMAGYHSVNTWKDLNQQDRVTSGKISC